MIEGSQVEQRSHRMLVSIVQHRDTNDHLHVIQEIHSKHSGWTNHCHANVCTPETDWSSGHTPNEHRSHWVHPIRKNLDGEILGGAIEIHSLPDR